MKNEPIPTIEPPCSDCVAERTRTRSPDALCDHHSERARPHTYHYERQLPLRQHDSNVIPTGVGDPRHQR